MLSSFNRSIFQYSSFKLIRSLEIHTTHPEVETFAPPASITPLAETRLPDNCVFSSSSGALDSYQLYSPHAAEQHLHHPQPVHWGTPISTEPCHFQHRPIIYPACSDQDSARPPLYHMESTPSHQPVHNDSFQPYSSGNNNAVIRDIWRILL